VPEANPGTKLEEGRNMPDKETVKKAKQDLKEGSRPRPQQASLFDRRSITFGRGNMERDLLNKPSPSG
jgi:hypothetical protein